MARAEQVWLQEIGSAFTFTVSPDPLIHISTSLPLGLSWVSLTLPVSSRMRLRTGWPSQKRISSRANVRARAQEAISMHSSFDIPVNNAEAHISTRCSAILDGPEGDGAEEEPQRELPEPSVDILILHDN